MHTAIRTHHSAPQPPAESLTEVRLTVPDERQCYCLVGEALASDIPASLGATSIWFSSTVEAEAFVDRLRDRDATTTAEVIS